MKIIQMPSWGIYYSAYCKRLDFDIYSRRPRINAWLSILFISYFPFIRIRGMWHKNK